MDLPVKGSRPGACWDSQQLMPELAKPIADEEKRGICLKELSATQRSAALAMVSLALSRRGFENSADLQAIADDAGIG